MFAKYKLFVEWCRNTESPEMNKGFSRQEYTSNMQSIGVFTDFINTINQSLTKDSAININLTGNLTGNLPVGKSILKPINEIVGVINSFHIQNQNSSQQRIELANLKIYNFTFRQGKESTACLVNNKLMLK